MDLFLMVNYKKRFMKENMVNMSPTNFIVSIHVLKIRFI